MDKDKIVGVIDLIDQGIENGSLKVEQVHREIADKPWEIMKKIPTLAGFSDAVLGLQEQVIGNTYHSVRKVSKIISTQLKSKLSK
jgi:hypothetical protein